MQQQYNLIPPTNITDGLSRKLDQFYTRKDIAILCIHEALRSIGKLHGSTLYIEPAAGSGAFLDELPEPKIGIDLSPASGRSDILKADFLSWLPTQSSDNIVIITNVPFGKNSSTAIKFLNHASQFASYVASILPRTFEKESIKNKLSPKLHLIHQMAIEPNSFVFEGNSYSVPVVFQVYAIKCENRSKIIRETKHLDFSFVKNPNDADFAFQRVGARAGKISTEGLKMSPQSHYYIKVISKKINVQEILTKICWNQFKYCTAGNPSIGKSEIIAAYRKYVQ